MLYVNKILLAIILASLCACTSLQKYGNIEVGEMPICAPGVDLGNTHVILKLEWRSDQKRPHERERMARDVIKKVFQDLPCGRYMEENSTYQKNIHSLIEITLREFGPELVLSVPVFWSSNTDVDATIRVTDLGSGEVVFAASESRKDGGAFAIKSLSSVPVTFENLLVDWIGGK